VKSAARVSGSPPIATARLGKPNAKRDTSVRGDAGCILDTDI
jgi:hypothetical protein